jgi:hypothetical protein
MIQQKEKQKDTKADVTLENVEWGDVKFEETLIGCTTK